MNGITVLLHKQKLGATEKKKLLAGGIVSIQTNDPESFKLINAEVPQFSTGDLVWALLSAIDVNQSYDNETAKSFVKRLAQLATEDRNSRLGIAQPISVLAGKE